MWYEISSERDINDFMKKINFFHDCCIKELKYSSGAYVNNRYEMYPLKNTVFLFVIFLKPKLMLPLSIQNGQNQ